MAIESLLAQTFRDFEWIVVSEENVAMNDKLFMYAKI
jgi:hypothetical protein